MIETIPRGSFYLSQTKHVSANNIVPLLNAASTLLPTQMLPSLAARETFVADANLASRTQGSVQY